MMTNKEQGFKHILNQLDIDMEPNPGHQQRLRSDMLSVYQETAKTYTGRRAGVDWRALMKSPLTKMTAAAVILIAFIVMFMSTGESSVAWGTLLDRLSQIDYTYHLQWIITQEQREPAVIDSVIYKSQTYGIRQDSYVAGQPLDTVYVPRDDHTMTQLMHTTQQVITTVMSQEQMDKIQQKTDPTLWIKEALRFQHTDLEPRDLNGIMVEGIEVNDPNYMAMLFEQTTCRIWVGVDSQLPVRIEINGTSESGRIANEMISSDFDWDVELGPEVFEPNIPAGYQVGTPLDASDSEAAAIGSLRDYAALTRGQYPSQLNIMSYWREAIMAIMLDRFTDPNAEYPDNPQMPLTLKDIRHLASLKHMGVFYGELMTDCNEVTYYGDKVMAQNKDMVLLRWRDKEDHYKVIFAGLALAQVTAEELTALEQDPEFLALLEQPRPLMPLLTQGPVIANQETDLWRIVNTQEVKITSDIQLCMWDAKTDAIEITLPYAAGVLDKVICQDQEVTFTDQGQGQYRIDLPTHSFRIENSHFTCYWRLPLASLQQRDDSGYEVQLQGLLPVLNYQLDVELTEASGFVHYQDPTKKRWMAFSQGSIKPQSHMESCGLGIRRVAPQTR